jgi:hypothetical protein
MILALKLALVLFAGLMVLSAMAHYFDPLKAALGS